MISDNFIYSFYELPFWSGEIECGTWERADFEICFDDDEWHVASITHLGYDRANDKFVEIETYSRLRNPVIFTSTRDSVDLSRNDDISDIVAQRRGYLTNARPVRSYAEMGAL
jgi:hypothetical protein